MAEAAAIAAITTAVASAGSAAVSYSNMQKQQAAQKKQAELLAAERGKVDGELKSQKDAAAGGRGLLAYVDEDLRKTLGGAR